MVHTEPWLVGCNQPLHHPACITGRQIALENQGAAEEAAWPAMDLRKDDEPLETALDNQDMHLDETASLAALLL